ncbi:hypothetical protein FHS78_003240 [Parvibaculum indicum]|uniref:type I restriction endonuclease n=1 Tax=Parvibaculum indicum TaxID=562969 RepID=UPI001FE47D25|nr:type I restriction endonuclease [Parvibaculum indicum]NIJ42932.1 hypothetical protein [Parvibaculum indicum]
MTIEQQIRTLSDRVREHSDSMGTEEAVKTAVVLPFFQALGYDVFNPAEVIPELTADAVGKKGEKVDYAIKVDDQIRILVECKPITTQLQKSHLAQLFRYFTVTSAKFAILTNGREFQFYSDLEEPNKLDGRPFLTIDLAEFSNLALSELKKFEKAEFDVDGILASAERLKYTSLFKSEIAALIDNPSEDFVKLIAANIHEGRFTSQIVEKYTNLVRAAFREVIRDSVQNRLSSALASSEGHADDIMDDEQHEEEIVTTEEEREGFLMVRAIVRDTIDSKRVTIRDQKSYCGILIDDNNRKPLCRLHLNRSVKYISLFDSGSEERIPIGSLDDIYNVAERLRATAAKYAPKSKANASAPVAPTDEPPTSP